MRVLLIFTIYISFVIHSSAQIGIGTEAPHQESALEITSPNNNKGLLFNTVALQSTVSHLPLSAHHEGMIVYNTATNGTGQNRVFPGFYYNDGSLWIRMYEEEQIGTIKQGFETADHNGWYLLNGRAISTMSETVRNKAIAIGITSTLPNASNRMLKGKSSTESLLASGGSVSFSILQTHLPNIVYTGTTSTEGNHSHNYTNRGNTLWHVSTGTAFSVSNNHEGETRTTQNAGNHSHTFTVQSGGSNTPVPLIPQHIIVQSFIFLGN